MRPRTKGDPLTIRLPLEVQAELERTCPEGMTLGSYVERLVVDRLEVVGRAAALVSVAALDTSLHPRPLVQAPAHRHRSVSKGPIPTCECGAYRVGGQWVER